MSKKLKPCPFCGEEAVLDYFDDDEWYVYCPNLEGDCEIRPSTKFYQTKQEAIDVWNRRASDGEG